MQLDQNVEMIARSYDFIDRDTKLRDEAVHRLLKAIDEGIAPDAAAAEMLDAIAAGTREIIVAEGAEKAMGEARRTPDALFDQVAAMVAAGYMQRLKGE